MKELEFINIIKNTLTYSNFLGDDCAFLEDLDIFTTHDSLIEDVHFSRSTTSPYLLGRKSVAVNLSDLAASLSEPKYVSVSLSLPSSIDENFVKEFYRGINDICEEYNVKVVGGDITRSEKVFISILAIGKKTANHLTSRSFAKKGDLVLTTGNYGASACGLFCLQNNLKAHNSIIEAHTNPTPKVKEALEVAKNVSNNISAMDTSDGLMDAIFKISQASKCKIEVDFNKLPVKNEVIEIAKNNNINYEDWVLWGGEDYELIICVPETTYKNLDPSIFKVIGKVTEEKTNGEVMLEINDSKLTITNDIFENKSFKHFEEKQ